MLHGNFTGHTTILVYYTMYDMHNMCEGVCGLGMVNTKKEFVIQRQKSIKKVRMLYSVIDTVLIMHHLMCMVVHGAWWSVSSVVQSLYSLSFRHTIKLHQDSDHKLKQRVR